ncbi:MAG: hypothetical protein HUJ31_05950, partial [Pseudomonadales bacterium]|nr:hypothetical protein [Pseudomonadales bacterium]
RTGDAAALATAIRQGLSSPKSPATLTSRASEFSAARAAEDALAIYRGLTGSSTGRQT